MENKGSVKIINAHHKPQQLRIVGEKHTQTFPLDANDSVEIKPRGEKVQVTLTPVDFYKKEAIKSTRSVPKPTFRTNWSRK